MSNDNNNAHVISYGKYVLVWIALIALTSLTVTVSGFHLGNYILLITMTIAAIEALLVVKIFMHLKIEDPIFSFFIIITLITLFVIFGLTSLDFLYR